MPVDSQALNAAIEEASAGDAEIAGLLREKFSKNDNAAVAFVGGFMRNKDYTVKNQSLSGEKKKLEDQIALYQQNLESAEAEKNKIMKDLANQKVTAAQANARLQAVKETYQLSDEDIPPMGDLIDTRKKGKVVDSTEDLDTRMADMKKEIMDGITKTLVPELAGMANLDIVWSEIADEHRELTGKRLTASERNDILREAREKNTSLTNVWETKFNVPDARKKVERETWEKESRARWDAEQTAKRSQEAMEGIRPGAADESGLRLSPVLRKEFAERGEDRPAPGAPQPGDKPRAQPSAVQRESLTGAERAAHKFLERRAAGVPMGGREPVGKTA